MTRGLPHRRVSDSVGEANLISFKSDTASSHIGYHVTYKIKHTDPPMRQYFHPDGYHGQILVMLCGAAKSALTV
jgi:hypothetical protein